MKLYCILVIQIILYIDFWTAVEGALKPKECEGMKKLITELKLTT
jgi:hypothetical protein